MKLDKVSYYLITPKAFSKLDSGWKKGKKIEVMGINTGGEPVWHAYFTMNCATHKNVKGEIIGTRFNTFAVKLYMN